MELKEIFTKAYNSIAMKYIDSSKAIERVENNEVKQIKYKIGKLNEQIHILTRLRSSGHMESAIFISKKDEIMQKIEQFKRLKIKIEKGNNIHIDNKNNIIKYIQKIGYIKKYDSEIFKKIVKEIHIEIDKSITFRLKNDMKINHKFRGNK